MELGAVALSVDWGKVKQPGTKNLGSKTGDKVKGKQPGTKWLETIVLTDDQVKVTAGHQEVEDDGTDNQSNSRAPSS